MRYVAQQDELGCFIAAAAMVLDLTYAEVWQTVPLQDPSLYAQSGINYLGLIALDRIEELALAHGKEAVAVDPFVARAGLRYIAVIATSIPKLNHALAVDETGIAFDPIPENERVRRLWSEYNLLGLLEFRPV